MRRALASLFCLVSACSPEPLPSIDTEPPRVIKVDPRGTNVNTEATVKVTFTESMSKETCNSDSIALVESALLVTFTTLAAEVDNPPMSATARAKFVPARVTLSANGDVAELIPLEPLSGVTAYTVLVGKKVADLHGNPIVDREGLNARHESQFTTAVAPDRITPVPSAPEADGAVNVPIDAKGVLVHWSEPVASNVALTEAFFLEEQPSLIPIKGAVIRDLSLREYGLVLAPRSEADVRDCPDGNPPAADTTLCPDTQYAVVLRGFADAAGNATVPERFVGFRFTTARCLDRQDPAINEQTVGAIRDESAVVTWKADENATGLVEYAVDPSFDAWTDFDTRCAVPGQTCGSVAGPLGELEGSTEVDPCSTLAEQRAMAGAYKGTVSLANLAPSTTYHYRVRVVDTSSNWNVVSQSPKSSFATLAPLPKMVLSELMANPLTNTVAGEKQEQAEYIELHNAGPTDISLAGWTFGRESSTTRYIVLDEQNVADGAGLVIPAGKFGLLVGTAFVKTRYALPVGTVILHARTATGTPSNALLGSGLSSTSPPALVLITPGGFTVSTFGVGGQVPSTTTHNDCDVGVAIERARADAQDVTSNWACANGNVPPGRSPGAANAGWPQQ